MGRKDPYRAGQFNKQLTGPARQGYQAGQFNGQLTQQAQQGRVSHLNQQLAGQAQQGRVLVAHPDAIKMFQRLHKLREDGIVGQHTRSALHSANIRLISMQEYMRRLHGV